jgi:hypothetical protein
MHDNPHSVTTRDDLLDAILERLQERADTETLAGQVEGLIRALRECEAEQWEPQAGGEDRLRVLMDERLAAFRFREPSMKAIDPVWRARAATYLAGEAGFREAHDEMKRAGVASPGLAQWEPIIRRFWGKELFRQAGEPTSLLITETLKARTYRGMSLRLAYAAWGTPNQSLEDFREKIERIVARMRPHD